MWFEATNEASDTMRTARPRFHRATPSPHPERRVRPLTSTRGSVSLVGADPSQWRAWLAVALAALGASALAACGTAASSSTLAISALSDDSGVLAVDVAPGGNFDLSRWDLQEPVGNPGSPTTIRSTQLVGSSGFQDDYFYTAPDDGAMTFWAPETGVHTANSKYPRSELRELLGPGAPANWSLMGGHELSATVSVVSTPDHVCIGQIKVGTPLDPGVSPTTKPLLELYYFANGELRFGLERDPSGGQTSSFVSSVQVGTPFTYSIRVVDGAVTVKVNDAAVTVDVPSAFLGYGHYFKAGSYNQSAGADPSVGSLVKFYSLSVTHSS